MCICLTCCLQFRWGKSFFSVGRVVTLLLILLLVVVDLLAAVGGVAQWLGRWSLAGALSLMYA